VAKSTSTVQCASSCCMARGDESCMSRARNFVESDRDGGVRGLEDGLVDGGSEHIRQFTPRSAKYRRHYQRSGPIQGSLHCRIFLPRHPPKDFNFEAHPSATTHPEMSPPFPCRHAWISTGVNLRAASSQRPQWIGNVRNTLRQRELSVSAFRNEEREEGSPIAESSGEASAQKAGHTSNTEETTAPDTTRPVAAKAKAPQSLKDIFPDLFGDTKPLIAR
jgi:hypothetical protein